MMIAPSNENHVVVEGLMALSTMVYEDAMDHGLYDQYLHINTIQGTRSALSDRLMQQVLELHEASRDGADYKQELADVVIMAASIAGYLGIDLGKQVEKKRIYNISRPMHHVGEQDGVH